MCKIQISIVLDWSKQTKYAEKQKDNFILFSNLGLLVLQSLTRRKIFVLTLAIYRSCLLQVSSFLALFLQSGLEMVDYF